MSKTNTNEDRSFEFVNLQISETKDRQNWINIISKIIPLAFSPNNENILIDHSNAVLNNLANHLVSLNASYAIIEHDYIDKDFLKDFQRYYLTCYQHYRKYCMRIHFFREKPSDNLIETNIAEKFWKTNYLGFIIIRPIPQAFIGRVGLIPLNESDTNVHLIRPEIEIHLFGITLQLRTSVFITQDWSVGACSPTSLWISLNILKKKWDLGDIPSISELVESNKSISGNFNRNFPNAGLYPSQMEGLIKMMGLEPDYISPEYFIKPNELIYGFIKYNVPLIVIIEWYDKFNQSFCKSNKAHTCVLTGFKLKYNPMEMESISKLELGKKKDAILLGSFIESLFIHDDRLGSYIEARIEPRCFNDTEQKGYELIYANEIGKLSIDGIWKLQAILIPIYPKIRVSFDHAQQLILNFHNILDVICEITSNPLQFLKPNDLIWDIYLSSSNKFKDEVRKNIPSKRKIEIMRNMLSDKLPRFFWVARCFCKTTGKFIMELIIDATDIDPPEVFYRIWCEEQYNNDLILISNIIIHQPFIQEICKKWETRFAESIDKKTILLSRCFLSVLNNLMKLKENKFVLKEIQC